MFPIGGLSRMERMLRPTEELWISLAGPLVNVLISAAIFGYMFCSARSRADQRFRICCSRPTRTRWRGSPTGTCCWRRSICCRRFRWTAGGHLRALLSYIRPEDQATRTGGVDGAHAGHQHGAVRTARAAVHAGVFRVVHLSGRGAGRRGGDGAHAHARHSGARRDDYRISHPGPRQLRFATPPIFCSRRISRIFRWCTATRWWACSAAICC